jgi:5-methylcytosine-specific restriction endonuclease McrA
MDTVHLTLFDGKVCTSCKEWKPLTGFTVHKRFKDGRNSRCTSCRYEREKAGIYKYQRENAERLKAIAKERVARPEVKERINAWRREWRKAHPRHNSWRAIVYRERMRKEQPERFYEQKRKEYRDYYHRFPEKFKAYHANRRAREQETGGTYTGEEFKALCDYYGNVCLCCEKAKKLHADHVIPLSKGGRNDITNLQPLCHNCNSRKHDKDTDYRPDGGAFARSLKT